MYEYSPRVQKALILLEQGRYPDAVKIVQEELALSPNHPYALHLLATCYYHQSGQERQALQAIDAALKLEPENPGCYQLKALILCKMGKHKKALGLIEQALQMEPDGSHIHAAKSYILISMDQWAAAERSARDALRIDPDDLYAGNLLATALRMQNKLDENAHLMSDLLAKDPEDALSHANTGWVHFHRGHYDKARTHFREALRLDPSFEPARIGMLETFKVQSVLYRWYVKYCFYMARMNKATQFFFIIGVLVLFRTLRNVAASLFDGQYAWVGIMIGVVYYMLLLWSWLANGVGNLIVMSDRYARHALHADERLDGLFVGGSTLLGVTALIFAAILTVPAFYVIGGTLLVSAIPFSCTFLNPNKFGRIFYGVVGLFLWCMGAFLACDFWTAGLSETPVKALVGTMALVVFVLATWLGAFGFLRR